MARGKSRKSSREKREICFCFSADARSKKFSECLGGMKSEFEFVSIPKCEELFLNSKLEVIKPLKTFENLHKASYPIFSP
jgi:hypothetical protein